MQCAITLFYPIDTVYYRNIMEWSFIDKWFFLLILQLQEQHERDLNLLIGPSYHLKEQVVFGRNSYNW